MNKALEAVQQWEASLSAVKNKASDKSFRDDSSDASASQHFSLSFGVLQRLALLVHMQHYVKYLCITFDLIAILIKIEKKLGVSLLQLQIVNKGKLNLLLVFIFLNFYF
jgi:hypothetical protein